MFNGKIHYKLSFSIAMLNYQRVSTFAAKMRPIISIGFHPPLRKSISKTVFFSPTISSGVTSTSVSATDMLVASFLVFTPTLPGTRDLILPADCDSWEGRHFKIAELRSQ